VKKKKRNNLKILLISPCADPNFEVPKGLMIPQLALHILEGLTPPEHEVTLVEEESEVLDLDERCDLVGISFMTANAPRAYHLAREFKNRGKTVVFGGVHPTILPEEALQYGDSVVIGEAEGVWEQLLDDFQNGGLQKKYHCPKPSLERYIPKTYGKSDQKKSFHVIPIMTTRGCPYDCEFCCVSDLYGKQIRHSPISNVIRDIEESGGKVFIFLDDNIIGKPKYAKELFRAMKPLNIKWGGQASISFVHDTELMKLAADSGCIALFFGVESVSEAQLKTMRKSIKEIYKIEEAIKRISDLGILFHASIVFGFDNDTTDIFPETLDFLRRNKVSSTSLNILTPYPGTRIYEQFKSEGRLLTTDWKHYDHSTVTFRPKYMSPDELQAGTLWVKKEFAKISSILRRLPANRAHPLLYLSMNLALRTVVKIDAIKFPMLIQELFESHIDESVIARTRAAIKNLDKKQLEKEGMRLLKIVLGRKHAEAGF
jgi:radical SAM superfamily enzyme YgiQ (UPF0313 family)